MDGRVDRYGAIQRSSLRAAPARLGLTRALSAGARAGRVQPAGVGAGRAGPASPPRGAAPGLQPVRAPAAPIRCARVCSFARGAEGRRAYQCHPHSCLARARPRTCPQIALARASAGSFAKDTLRTPTASARAVALTHQHARARRLETLRLATHASGPNAITFEFVLHSIHYSI